ncbi:MAG: hypothetical protein ACFFCS_05825 [Candidatus Hodarchaeota archaeon]
MSEYKDTGYRIDNDQEERDEEQDEYDDSFLDVIDDQQSSEGKDDEEDYSYVDECPEEEIVHYDQAGDDEFETSPVETGIEKELKDSSYPRRRDYDIDEHYWEKIDTPNKAYMLGIMASDGSVSGNYHTIRIRMLKDDNFFKKIQDEFETNIPVRDYAVKKTGSIMSRILINRKKMAQDLEKLGIHPSTKSYDLKFPDEKILQKKFQKDYIRGVFDGDGSISIHHDKLGNTRFIFAIYGTRPHLEKIQDILIKECNLSKTKIIYDTRTKNSHSLSYYGPQNVGKIFEYLYGNDFDPKEEICLERKYRMMKEAHEHYLRSMEAGNLINIEKFEQKVKLVLDNNPKNTSELARTLGRKRETIRKLVGGMQDVEKVYPDGRVAVWRIKGQNIPGHIYPDRFPQEVLHEALSKTQYIYFHKLVKLGYYDLDKKLSAREIGEELGETKNNVEKKIRLIKKRLRAVPENKLKKEWKK